MGQKTTTPGKTKYSQKAFLELEEKYNHLVETITIGIFSLGPAPDYPLVSANRMLVLMLGYDHTDQLIGRPVRDLLITPEDWDVVEADLVTCGQVTNREVLLRHHRGLDIFVALNARVERGPDNIVTGVEGFAGDVTEHRVFETEMQYHASELNRYALALTHANDKLNLLSSITRHDILNQLTAFGAYLELIKSNISDKKILDYITKEETISETIKAQILFTKDYQELGVLSPQWHDVKKTILTATATLPLPPHTLSVTFDNLEIYADPLLEKVFYNLVENSLRHGGALTRVTFSCTHPGPDGLTLIYEDNGVGVPFQYKEAIFNRQYFKHTGFGLFLSREILSMSGLSIRETGKPGKGARFEISVPEGKFRTAG